MEYIKEGNNKHFDIGITVPIEDRLKNIEEQLEFINAKIDAALRQINSLKGIVFTFGYKSNLVGYEELQKQLERAQTTLREVEETYCISKSNEKIN